MKKIFLILSMLFTFSAYADSASVVNSALQSGTISRVDARNIYLLKNRSWTDGTPIKVFRLPLSSKEHKEFVHYVLNYNDVQFESEWRKLVNVGLAPQVEEVQKSTDMLRSVNRKSNAVGYLNKDFLILNAGGYDVQVINIVD